MAGGDPQSALLLLAGMLCIIGASYSICYAIWSRGWEGWESWNARTGLDDEKSWVSRERRLTHEAIQRRDERR